jgi:hypothetical protein
LFAAKVTSFLLGNQQNGRMPFCTAREVDREAVFAPYQEEAEADEEGSAFSSFSHR